MVDPVPGCTVEGTMGVKGDFCVPAVYKDTESYLNAPTAAPTMAPTLEFQFPLEVAANDGDDLFPLSICQGRCRQLQT